MILTNVVEERWIYSSDYSSTTSKRLLARRELSQAMIPGSRLVRVEIDSTVYKEKVEVVES